MKSCFTGRGIVSIVALGLWLAHANISSAAQPIAPAVTGPDYDVTYNNDYGALSMDLYEMYGAGGSWAWVASGGGTVSFTGKAPGEYWYMTSELFVYYDEYWFPYYYYWSSPVTHVIVESGLSAPADSYATQSRYTYETRSGDIDGNGVLDVYVRRTSGGTAGNGTIESLILAGLGDGTFSQVVPSAYQASVANGWPILATQLVLKDFNLDGFIDIVLKDLGNAIAGALGQVIVSSGTSSLAAQGVIAMNAKYTKFGNELGNFINDPNWYYYDAVANGHYSPVYQWVQYCIYYPYWDENGYFWEYVDCWWVHELVGYYFDYSSYDQDGIQIANQIGVGADGWPIPDIAPGSAAARAIEQVLERVFGVRFMRGQLDYPCTYALAYDSDTALPCQNDLIGRLLLEALAALTQRGSCRPLTAGEIAGGSGEGLDIFRVNEVLVCNYGFLVLGRWWVMSPDGNIYVGPAQEVTSWSEDYSMAGVGDFSTLIHELTHVYQVKTIGCSKGCMLLQKMASLAGDGYDYTPMPAGKSFYAYNIEQQAQMVQDRFLRRNNWIPGADTRDATPAELNAAIPFGPRL